MRLCEGNLISARLWRKNMSLCAVYRDSERAGEAGRMSLLAWCYQEELRACDRDNL
jgi:hypothetical protein